MKKITVIALLLAAALGAQARNGSGKPAYKDAGRPVEERVSDLLSRMTLEEKVMQLNQYTLGRNDNANNVADPVDKIPAEIGSLIYFDTSPELRNRLQKKAIEQSRLGIPVLFGYDVIHGFRTTYPISLAQACSWNPALVKQAAEVAAQEARMSGVEWTFSPMIDVARDGRWGRVSEGYGEDPYANAVYGVAAVEGYQGDNLADSRRVAACLKHFVGYGASEAGRDYVYTEISRQTLWDTYIPPYQAGIEAGAATVMSCFNDISGTPGTANPYILTEVLKERWAHDGFVVSDWAAIEQLRSQGVAADRKEAAEKAFNAGVEMDMMNRCYDAHLAALVREGKVSQEKLDEAVRRVLRLKFRLGLFERPYTPESEETDRFLLPASLAVAERLAEESMVLLKNEGGVLPIDLGRAKTIAVVGENAIKMMTVGGGSSSLKVRHEYTPLEGIRAAAAGKAEVIYERGYVGDVTGDYNGVKTGQDLSESRSEAQLIADAAAAARKADAVIFVGGLNKSNHQDCEGDDRLQYGLPYAQDKVIGALAEANPNLAVVIVSGNAVAMPWIDRVPAVLEAWFSGSEAGNALADVVFGAVNPSGKLPFTFPVRLEDNGAHALGEYPGADKVKYNESIFVGYRWHDKEQLKPLFAFGHGLSYTAFAVGNVKADRTTLAPNGSIRISADVTNTGDRAGAEVVQLYIGDEQSSLPRPVKELKGFQKVSLNPGQTRTVTFEITPGMLQYYDDAKGAWVAEPGAFTAYVGAASDDIRGTVEFELK